MTQASPARSMSPSIPSKRVFAGPPKLAPRRPLVLLGLALSAGIMADHFLHIALSRWLLCFAGFWLISVHCWRRRHTHVAEWSLLITTVALGGAWHQYQQFVSDRDISHFSEEESKLCRGQAVVLHEAARKVAESPRDWERSPSWSLRVEVTRIKSGADWIDADGGLMIHLEGSRPDCQPGDTIEFLGWLANPQAPLNASDFDYPRYLRTLGIRAVLYCNGADSVRVLHSPLRPSSGRLLAYLRQHASVVINEYLPTGQVGLAEALLIGNRQSLSREELQPFFESGTMHLLVISGFHLALIAGLFWWVARILGLAPRRRALVVLGLTWIYAGVTGANPPVIRAAVMLSFFLLSYVVDRPSVSLNSLAGAAIILLIADPSNLFASGPQLSFLAVFAIVLFCGRPGRDGLDPLEEMLPWWHRVLKWLFRLAWGSIAFSGTIWLIVTPLILTRFQLFTPASIFLSVLLTLPMLVALVSGLALLFCSAVNATLAGWVASVFELSLWIIEHVAEFAEWSWLRPMYLPPFPDWWVVGFYAALLLPWLIARQFRIGVWYVSAIIGWLAIGVTAFLIPSKVEDLEYHQLAVGHGSCAVVRFPNGQTLLYDCGSLKGPEVTQQVIALWLWQQRITSIDAVLLSHADVDHFNGIESLANRFPIGVVYVSPQFVRSDETRVREAADFLIDSRIPLRFIWAGDEIGPADCPIRVLLPHASDQHPTDNSASLVAAIDRGGVRLLMTGDLEKRGLQQLLRQPERGAEIFIAPHHGSRMSNIPQVAQWADAKVVVSSQGFHVGPVLPAYENAHRLTTHLDGTISCRWRGEGVEVSTFRTKKRFVVNPRE